MTAILAVAGCGSSESSLDKEGKKVCTQLATGESIANIYVPTFTQRYDAQAFAGRLVVWAEDFCPDQLRSNDALRSYLEVYGIAPDA